MIINTYKYNFNSPINIHFGCAKSKTEDDIQNLLNDINQRVYLFDNPNFYSFFDKNKEAMIEKIKKLYNIRPWGRIKERKIIPEFTQTVSNKHIALLCDPGIVSRLDEFYKFVKYFSGDINKLSPLELRKKFSDYLGNKTYYRGMLLNQEQIDEIKEKGIISNNFKGENSKDILEDLLCGYKNPRSVSYKDFMYAKANGDNANNPLISVTQIKSIAQNVPARFCPYNTNQKIYIFELEIPKINVIEPKGEFNITYSGFGFYDNNGNSIPQEQIESFIPFIINPEYQSKQPNINQIFNKLLSFPICY